MTTPAKSKRKAANSPVRPEPGEREREAMGKAARRQLARSPRFELAEAADGAVCSPHADAVGWAVRLMDGLGTASLPFAEAQLGALGYAGRARGSKVANSEALNAALAFVGAVNPENELEAALAGQMAGVHSLTAEMLGRAKQTDRTDHIALYGGLAVKLARTFAAQTEALAKLRGGGKQQVEVKHVYVNGNAVVGDVHAGPGPGPGGGDASESAGRPHAQALAYQPGAPVPPVWSSHPPGDALPLACGDGAQPVPDARRR